MKTRTRTELEGILKGLFFISLVPYALVLGFAIYSAFAGHSNLFLDSTLYGVEAILYIIYIFFGFFTFVIPVFPVLAIYQIFYVVFSLRQRKRKALS